MMLRVSKAARRCPGAQGLLLGLEQGRQRVVFALRGAAL